MGNSWSSKLKEVKARARSATSKSGDARSLAKMLEETKLHDIRTQQNIMTLTEDATVEDALEVRRAGPGGHRGAVKRRVLPIVARSRAASVPVCCPSHHARTHSDAHAAAGLEKGAVCAGHARGRRA